VLVDRGFLPFPIDQARATQPYAGTVDGLVRQPPSNGKAAWYDVADNNPGKNQWYRVDIAAMAEALGLGHAAPVYLEVLQPTGAHGPVPTGQRILGNIRNEHLQYAITWFALAGALAVIYVVWTVRGERQA
jgi:surfeit locus 1 family protein